MKISYVVSNISSSTNPHAGPRGISFMVQGSCPVQQRPKMNLNRRNCYDPSSTDKKQWRASLQSLLIEKKITDMPFFDPVL
jgi:hypothetical protein